MDNTRVIVASYERLTGMMQRQLEILSEQELDDRFQQFAALSLEWSLLSHQVEDAVSMISGYDHMLPQEREAIRASVEAMKALSSRMESMLTKQQNHDFETMQSIKKKQTTLRSYGGLGHEDSIPLYLDERK